MPDLQMTDASAKSAASSATRHTVCRYGPETKSSIDAVWHVRATTASTSASGDRSRATSSDRAGTAVK